MTITLPVRGSGGGRREAGIKIADAGDVPMVREASDPGVTVPAGAFGGSVAGMQHVADDLTRVSERMQTIEAAQQTRRDVVANQIAENKFNDAITAEKLRLESGGTADDPIDIADPVTLSAFGQHLNDSRDSVLANYGGSDAGRQTAAAKLDAMRGEFARDLGMKHAQAGHKMIETAAAQDINQHVAWVSQDPTQLPAMMESFNKRIETLAPALKPEAVTALTSEAYRRMTLAGVHYYLDRGDDESARAYLSHAPNATKLLTTDDQQALNKSFASAELERTKGVREAQNWVGAFKYVNKREPTATERMQFSKVGDNSPIGKLIADQASFAAQYGANSPQARAFDGAIAKESSGGEHMSAENAFRGQYAEASRSFVATRDAFSRIAASAETPSAAGDLALIYGFARLLSPQGAVTDADYSNLASSGSLGTQIQAAWQRASTGQRMTDEQRADMLAQSKAIFTTSLKTQAGLETQYRGIAKRSGLAGDNVLDYIGDYRAALVQPVKPPEPEAVKISGDAEYNALPKGAAFIGPDGQRRVKP